MAGSFRTDQPQHGHKHLKASSHCRALFWESKPKRGVATVERQKGLTARAPIRKERRRGEGKASPSDLDRSNDNVRTRKGPYPDHVYVGKAQPRSLGELLWRWALDLSGALSQGPLGGPAKAPWQAAGHGCSLGSVWMSFNFSYARTCGRPLPAASVGFGSLQATPNPSGCPR